MSKQKERNKETKKQRKSNRSNQRGTQENNRAETGSDLRLADDRKKHADNVKGKGRERSTTEKVLRHEKWDLREKEEARCGAS